MTADPLSITHVVLGVIAVVVLAHHLWMQRKIYDARLELERKKYQTDEEARGAKFAAEQRERQAREEFFVRETARLGEASDLLADTISLRLRRNVDWATEALDRAKLAPKSNSLFAERMSHFREEKIVLAEKFVRFLLRRSKEHIHKGRSVLLVIDSGSTLTPLLDELGKGLVQMYEDKEYDELKSLHLASNNLPGIAALMNSGRVNPNNAYSSLAIDTRLLPGAPVPVFEAVTGPETIDALVRIRKEIKTDTVLIAVVTGNWIRLRRNRPVCPVPLARGPGHLEFKQALINCCDEVFVIAPLGKIFADVGPETVNPALGLRANHPNPAMAEYGEVDISEALAKKVRLVSTSREDPIMVLFQHSQKVRTCLQFDGTIGTIAQSESDFLTYADRDIGEVAHFLFPFEKLPSSRLLQIEYEFPHTYTRRDDFMRTFFGVR